MSAIKHSDIPSYLCHTMFNYIQSTDPTLDDGADVVAYETWVDTSAVILTSTATLRVRSEDNTAWVKL